MRNFTPLATFKRGKNRDFDDFEKKMEKKMADCQPAKCRAQARPNHVYVPKWEGGGWGD